MYNHLCLEGRLANDPELKYSSEGKAIATVSIACERDYKKEGEDDADFLSIVLFGNKAEKLVEYRKKGDRVIAAGRLRIRKWVAQDGTKKSTPEMLADSVRSIESKAEVEARRAKDGNGERAMDFSEDPFGDE